MKILITGKAGYISNALEKWLLEKNEDYKIDKISLRTNEWKEHSFSTYDVVVHTVGIAHVDSNPDDSMKREYFRINRDLAIEVAKKSKRDGVKQFVQLSSIIVYGKQSEINKYSKPKPENFYGDSKLEAEKGIESLISNEFRTAILRLPMVYGLNTKGNYQLLSKFARRTFIFPSYNNKRSMIHIDNLCEFIYLIIKNKESGYFHPQNEEYVETSNLVRKVSEYHRKKVIFTSLFNPIISILVKKVNIFNKVFGNLYYHQDISKYKTDYNVKSFEESIKLTEKKL